MYELQKFELSQDEAVLRRVETLRTEQLESMVVVEGFDLDHLLELAKEAVNARSERIASLIDDAEYEAEQRTAEGGT